MDGGQKLATMLSRLETCSHRLGIWEKYLRKDGLGNVKLWGIYEYGDHLVTPKYWLQKVTAN